MKKIIRRTVQTVLHQKIGPIEAEDFFLPSQPFGDPFKVRTEIEEQLQRDTPIIVCLFCKQPVKISGGGEQGKILHFKHLNGSEDCGQKSKNNYTKDEIRCIKYNGAKESEKHYTLKHAIADYLTLTPNVKNGAVEKVVKNKAIPRKWRKPDISAEFNSKKVVLELQISTTFLSVIVARNVFYKAQEMFIIWVFDDFSLSGDLQKFTQKDIFHNNAFNVYVFDEEAKGKSEERKELILKCFYKKYHLSTDKTKIEEIWHMAFVSLEELTFDDSKYQVLFHDSDQEKANLEPLVKKIQTKSRHTNRYWELEENNYDYEENYYLPEEEEWESDDPNNLTTFEIEQQERSYFDTLQNDTKRDLVEQENIAHEIRTQLLAFFKDDNLPKYGIQRKIKSLNAEGIRYLNQILEFKDINDKPFLNALIHSKKHDNLALFLFRCDSIELEFSRLDNRGTSLLQEILLRKEDFSYQGFFITLLFERGYNITQSDKGFLKSEYEEGDINYKKLILKISFFSQVTQKQHIEQISRIHSVLFIILSGKKKKVVGSKLPNLLALANNALEYYADYWEFIELAFRKYGVLSKIQQLDKKGNFKKKLQRYLSNKPKQRKEYLPLLSILFPKVFEVKALA